MKEMRIVSVEIELSQEQHSKLSDLNYRYCLESGQIGRGSLRNFWRAWMLARKREREFREILTEEQVKTYYRVLRENRRRSSKG